MSAWVVYFIVYALLIFIVAWMMELYKKGIRGTTVTVYENGKPVQKRVTKAKAGELWLVASIPSYILGWAFYYMLTPPVELHKGIIFVYGTILLIMQRNVDMVLIKRILTVIRLLRNSWLRQQGVSEEEINKLG